MRPRRLASTQNVASTNPAVTLGDIFSKLTPTQRETVEKILVSLLDTNNIEMKTEIQVPLNVTRLELLGHWASLENAPQTSSIITKFCNFYRVNMVSHDRLSRKEIISALSERLKSEDKTLAEKLTEPPT